MKCNVQLEENEMCAGRERICEDGTEDNFEVCCHYCYSFTQGLRKGSKRKIFLIPKYIKRLWLKEYLSVYH